MLAVIALSFDPLLHLGPMTIRWQTIGVTIALLAAFSLAAFMAPDLGAQRPFFRRRRPAPVSLKPTFPHAPIVDHTGRSGPLLRLDDMLLIVVGAVPGAVLGGRLVHALDFWDAYMSHPGWLVDPLVGTLSLTGALLGGFLTAAYAARLIGAPVRRWADAAAVPLLLAMSLGKLAQLLGGSGQGLPFDGPWAVAFLGPGPWVSASPEIASHPAQAYEGLLLLIGIPVVLLLAGPRWKPVRVHRWVAWMDRSAEEGRLFTYAMGWFLVGRILVGFTWRDDPFIGPLNTEQVVALAVLAGILAGLWLVRPRGTEAARAP